MAHEERGDRSLVDRARELYWDSARSVNSIAEDLGLSKGALYELIQPLEAGTLCPECGSELVFATRTARDRSEATCPFCGSGDEEDGVPSLQRAHRFAGGPSAGRPLRSQSSSWTGGSPKASRTLGGVLIAATAAILLIRYLRR
jgi:hypothetical protein